MSSAIEFQNVTKRFDAHVVVNDISLVVEPGELFFLLGPSGCGKTTLLRCLAGFHAPESGRILIGGRDVTALQPEQRDTGMVFQSYALWPHLTVRENVAFGLQLRKVPAAELRARVDEALALVRMTDRADYKPAQLSGGQQQRVALARALVVRPACLLLDEPLSNLDAKLRLDMRTEIRRICKSAGLTAMYVTHDQKEALSIADRLAIMDKGRLQQVGTPREVYRTPNSTLVAGFIGETNFVPGVVQDASSAQVVVTTELGTIISTAARTFDPQRGARVVVSIRPEVVRVHGDGPAEAVPNRLAAMLHESVYLGELAQHDLRFEGTDLTMKAYELHPDPAAITASRRVAVSFASDDVVVLPA